MRNSILLVLICFSAFASSLWAQGYVPCKPAYSISKTGYKAGDTVELIITFAIDKGWCLYSSEFAADGPIKFACSIEPSLEFKIIDSIRAYQPFAHFDEVWGGEVKLFEGIGQFRQKLVVMKAGSIKLNATLEGQVCNESCIPVNFEAQLDLATLPLGQYMAASPSVYKHYQHQAGK